MSVAMMLAAAALAASAQSKPDVLESATGVAQPAADSTTDQVTVKRDEADRMTVPVTVAGKGPYRFLVDTGSERTVISRQLAEKLKLDAGMTTVLHSVIGSNSVGTVFIPDLRVSTNSISVVDAPALEATDIGADGMLGIDSLRAQSVTFDFKGNTMAITTASTPRGNDGDTVVVRAKSRKGRLIFTDAYVDGMRVTIIVDTGSQVTIGNAALEKSLLKRRKWGVPDGVTVESVTGEKMSAKVAVLDRLDVGGLHIDGLAVAFADAHIFRQLDLNSRPALLLGMNAMRAFDRITIDFAAKKVRFRLPESSMLEGSRLALLSR